MLGEGGWWLLSCLYGNEVCFASGKIDAMMSIIRGNIDITVKCCCGFLW